MNNWKLFLDDLRQPKDCESVQAYSFEQAVEMIKERGVPSFISFDHDLGINPETGNVLPTGYDLARWIIEQDMNGTYIIPEGFNFKVHSANPVGAENIRNLLYTYLNRKKR